MFTCRLGFGLFLIALCAANDIKVSVIGQVQTNIRLSSIVGSLVPIDSLETKEVLVNSGLQNLILIGFRVFEDPSDQQIFQNDVLAVSSTSSILRASGLKPAEVVTVDFLIQDDDIAFNITFTGQEPFFSEDTFIISQ